jgi:GH24 family phage-related lysozyme (muramidase)
MKTSITGIDMIKRYEGIRLSAYKPVSTEKYWTIGYGHYGPDVARDAVITYAQAEAYLRSDLEKFEKAVDALGTWTQSQFDALVSFAYNCGSGNVKRLCKGRTPQQIADAMLLYNKAGGKVLAGLTRRRQEERALFLSGQKETAPATGNPYAVPSKTLRVGSKGNGVRWLQYELNTRGFGLVVDGVFGPKTETAVRRFQDQSALICDGVVGPATREALLKV